MNLSNINEIPLHTIEITVVYDNTSWKSGFTGDWGFSCIVSGKGMSILFDTGAEGDLLLSNMDRTRWNPEDVETVFLSHDHWDHTGGIETFLQLNPDVQVFLPDSFSENIKTAVTESGAGLVEVSRPEEICSGAFTTGPMVSAPEEQALLITTDEGVVVITGCAHPGITETVRRAKEITGDDILLVIGGFHLRSRTEREVLEIIHQFRDLGVQYAAPCHCTGESQIDLFRQEYGDRFIETGAGRILTGSDIRRQ